MAQKRNVTVQDIADFCGLARGTVSMALRDDERIAAKTRERVQKAARDLGYDPSLNVAARRLSLARHGRQVRNHVIAITVPADYMQVEYFRRIVQGAWSRLTQAQYGMLIFSPESGDGLDPLTRGEIDGLICLGHAHLADTIRELRQRRGFGDRPMVGCIYPISGAPSVLSDDALGARQATHRLLDLGHRHILRLYPAKDGHGLDVPSRREATAGVMVERGLDLDSHLHSARISMDWMTPADAHERLAHRANIPADRPLLDFLQAHPQITALQVNNDAQAIFVYAALRDAGFDVPGRYSLIGFDDTDPIPNAQGQNILSSVSIPLVEIGRRAAGMTLQAVDDEDARLDTVLMPTSFVERGSVAPPAQV